MLLNDWNLKSLIETQEELEVHRDPRYLERFFNARFCLCVKYCSETFPWNGTTGFRTVGSSATSPVASNSTVFDWDFLSSSHKSYLCQAS